MTRSLPPLAAIRAFEATARLGSFTKAATELGMTQAAVSYQIRLLEERVEARLFLRQPRGIILSEAGRLLAPGTIEAFALLRSTFATARKQVQEVLAISSVSTFASNWLVSRLGSFQMAHPDLAVRLDTASHLVDFAREDFDLGIRTGDGAWPELVAHQLLPKRYTPMLTPALAESIGGVRQPADLLRLPIINPRDPWWRRWFAAAGIADPELERYPDVDLGSQQLDGGAALEGQGVAILTPAFFASALRTGALIQPFDLVQADDGAYWLVYPERLRTTRKIRLFRDWLLAEVAAAGLLEP